MYVSVLTPSPGFRKEAKVDFGDADDAGEANENV